MRHFISTSVAFAFQWIILIAGLSSPASADTWYAPKRTTFLYRFSYSQQVIPDRYKTEWFSEETAGKETAQYQIQRSGAQTRVTVWTEGGRALEFLFNSDNRLNDFVEAVAGPKIWTIDISSCAKIEKDYPLFPKRAGTLGTLKTAAYRFECGIGFNFRKHDYSEETLLTNQIFRPAQVIKFQEPNGLEYWGVSQCLQGGCLPDVSYSSYNYRFNPRSVSKGFGGIFGGIDERPENRGGTDLGNKKLSDDYVLTYDPQSRKVEWIAPRRIREVYDPLIFEFALRDTGALDSHLPAWVVNGHRWPDKEFLRMMLPGKDLPLLTRVLGYSQGSAADQPVPTPITSQSRSKAIFLDLEFYTNVNSVNHVFQVTFHPKQSDHRWFYGEENIRISSYSPAVGEQRQPGYREFYTYEFDDQRPRYILLKDGPGLWTGSNPMPNADSAI